MIFQLCGLSGAGKTTIAKATQTKLSASGIESEIIDGDEYRETLCRDLGFSRQDRIENINRLAFVASKLSSHGIITIISAINPYEDGRQNIFIRYKNVKTIYIDCSVATLQKRDTKGLYKKAFLPDGHPEKLKNLSGINDPFDTPLSPDLIINTDWHSREECANIFFSYIQEQYKRVIKIYKATA